MDVRKKRRRKPKPLLLGSARRTSTAAGRVVLRIRLKRSALGKLRGRRVRARLSITFTPRGGKRTSVSRSVTLRRTRG